MVQHQISQLYLYIELEAFLLLLQRVAALLLLLDAALQVVQQFLQLLLPGGRARPALLRLRAQLQLSLKLQYLQLYFSDTLTM